MYVPNEANEITSIWCLAIFCWTSIILPSPTELCFTVDIVISLEVMTTVAGVFGDSATKIKITISNSKALKLPLTSPRMESILEWGKWSTSLKRSFFGKFGSKSKSVSLKSFKIACDTICSRCSGWKSIRLKEKSKSFLKFRIFLFWVNRKCYRL